MNLENLSEEQLIEELTWAKCIMMIRQMEPRYEKQPREEQTKEYHELHAVYRKYWDEAFRRGMVEKSSEQIEKE